MVHFATTVALRLESSWRSFYDMTRLILDLGTQYFDIWNIFTFLAHYWKCTKEAPIYFSNIFISFLGLAYFTPLRVIATVQIFFGTLVGPLTLLHPKMKLLRCWEPRELETFGFLHFTWFYDYEIITTLDELGNADFYSTRTHKKHFKRLFSDRSQNNRHDTPHRSSQWAQVNLNNIYSTLSANVV